ncbi:MAG TPA: hypothetical protein VHF22_09655 [Planctomycetota bacterium]|nr:hypothetical protein [Planctomycetota bacterium]
MPTKEELDRALKAFKKRLKLTRRDNESNYGGGALSGGKVSSIVAVAPPEGFPQEVWDGLVAAGKLKRTPGQRTYELVQQPPT